LADSWHLRRIKYPARARQNGNVRPLKDTTSAINRLRLEIKAPKVSASTQASEMPPKCLKALRHKLIAITLVEPNLKLGFHGQLNAFFVKNRRSSKTMRFFTQAVSSFNQF